MDIKEILRIVEAKIAVHKEFRSAYNKQYAFDFNLFNFFGIDENKVTAILAYFLNPEATHGQGDLFLKEFISMFFDETPETGDNVKIRCEEPTDKGRRIDLYIELQDVVIGIENKLNAEDQNKQLTDYADYLSKKKSEYLLLYLNPEGVEPSQRSIEDSLRKDIEEKKHFRIISYRNDISSLLDRWAGVCEADNVLHFIKQFKKYLKTRFIGTNTLNMDNALKTMILENIEPVTELVKAYEEIENEAIKRFDDIRRELGKESNYTRVSNLEYKWEGPFTYEGSKVYKLGISKGTNKVYIHFSRKRIDLFVRHYFEKGTDARFESIAKNHNLFKSLETLRDQSNSEIINLFWEQVRKVEKIIEEYHAL